MGDTITKQQKKKKKKKPLTSPQIPGGLPYHVCVLSRFSYIWRIINLSVKFGSPRRRRRRRRKKKIVSV